ACSNRPPAYAAPVLSVGDTFIWTAKSTDDRALHCLDFPGRIAAAWYAPTSLTIDVPLIDGRLHQIAFYFLDWDGHDQRSQTIEVRDATSGALLDRRILTAFSAGKYLSWQVRGNVRFVFSANNTLSVVFSALFFDRATNAPPEVTLSSTAGQVLQLPGEFEFVADAFDSDGQIVRVDLFAGGDWLAGSSQVPLTYIWTNAPAGTYALFARAEDDLGDTATSQTLELNAVLPQTRVGFLGQSSANQGNWIGRYGFEGFVIASYATNHPPYLKISSSDLRV